MAGFAYGLDDGGAIPDDQGESWQPGQDAPLPQGDDNSVGPAPALPQGDNGAIGSPAPQQQQQQQGSGVDFNAAHVPGNAKRIISYLMGADAAPPQVADKFRQGTSLEHPELNGDDQNLVAVHKAGEQGGLEAAWAMVQHNRVSYNAKQAFAKAALTGTEGKPADVQAAAQAATEASQHVLDGSTAKFVAGPNGTVTATVKMPGTKNNVNYNLTPQQFSQYLDVGGVGQWDKLMENGGIPSALQQLTGQRAIAGVQAGANGGPTQDAEDRGTQSEANDNNGQTQTQTTGQVAPLQYLSKQDQAKARDMGDTGPSKRTANPQYDDDLVARANQTFPWISQGAQRGRYLTQTQEARDTAGAEQQNKLDVAGKRAEAWEEVARQRSAGQVGAAHERAEGQVGAAQVRADSYAKAQQQKAQLALQQMAQRAKDANERNRINVATRLINNPNWATQSADERNAILKNYGLDQLMEPVSPKTTVSTPQAASPTQQQPSQSSGGAGQPGPGKKQFNGRWYTREEYRQAFGK